MAVINPAAYANNALPIYQYPNTATPTINPPAYTGTAFGQQTQELKSNTMIFVRGINEAANYPAVQPVLLMDATESVFYIKDQSGLRVFDYTERNQNGSNSTEYVTKQEFNELKKLIDELTK